VLAIPHEGEADVTRRACSSASQSPPLEGLGRPIEEVLPLQIYRDKNDQDAGLNDAPGRLTTDSRLFSLAQFAANVGPELFHEDGDAVVP
jgi:hypothetical protein